MNITFLIGNGFDLNIGLKTRYQDFYDYLKSSGTLSDINDKMKDLNNNSEIDLSTAMWSDLELGLGKFTNFFDFNHSDYVDFVEKIIYALASYIENEQNKIKWDTGEVNTCMRKSIYTFYNYLSKRDKAIISNIISGKDCTYRFISYNYSLIINKCIKIAYDNRNRSDGMLYMPVNIHGTTNIDMFLGVDNESQISNKIMLDNPYIRNLLIKPEASFNTGKQIYEECISLIDSSNIICLYGLSIGETDTTWWKQICKWLTNEKNYLVIFAYKDSIKNLIPASRLELEESCRRQFLSYSDLPKEKQDIISKRIILSINSEMFKMKLANDKSVTKELTTV